MFLRDLFENHSREVLVIYPGRFHPFHKGHAHVFQTAQAKFGDRNCFIVTSNKQDQEKSPFSFDEKKVMITATGISPDQVVQVKNPYSAKEVYSHYDPDNTVLIYVIGKDIDRMDLNTGAFKAVPEDLDTALPMSEQKYVFLVPSHEFTVLGKPVTGATELRDMYRKLDNEEAPMFIHDMFGEVNNTIQAILDGKLQRESKDPVQECIRKLDEILLLESPTRTDVEPAPRHPQQQISYPKRTSKRWGSEVFKGNKGVLARAYYKLNAVIVVLKDLDPAGDHDPEMMREVLAKMRRVKEMLQSQKGN